MVVIIMGPAGSGKTTVGRLLASSLGWPYHEGDDFHPPANVARMRSGLPLGDAERAPWLAALAALVAECIGTGTSAVIACSALKREYRQRLVPTNASSGDVRFVYLRGEPALLERRLAERRGHFFSSTLLASQLAALEEPGAAEPAPVLTVDAGAAPAEIVGAVRASFGV